MNGRRGSTVAIVQARTSSSRLPGKVLMDIHGAPMILRQLDRIQRAQSIDHIVVATSVDASDDDLAGIVQAAGYSIVRGPLVDVLGRFIQVIDGYHPDVVVRITADCPLMSPSVIDQVVQAFHASDAAYLSNTMMPTYPDGLDVEVVLADALQKVSVSSTDPQEREHVTLGVYRHPEHFAVENFVDPTGSDHSDLRWTVDNSDDLAFVTRVYGALFPKTPAFDYPEILELLETRPDLNRTERDSRRNAALDGLDTGAMHHQGSQVQP